MWKYEPWNSHASWSSTTNLQGSCSHSRGWRGGKRYLRQHCNNHNMHQSVRSILSQARVLFNIKHKLVSCNLRTCSGLVETWGKMAEGFYIESLDGSVVILLPPLIECQDIPNNRSEIPTPNAALHQPHLRSIAKYIPELDHKAEILLLLGRDVLCLHKVREQVNGSHHAPVA